MAAVLRRAAAAVEAAAGRRIQAVACRGWERLLGVSGFPWCGGRMEEGGGGGFILGEGVERWRSSRSQHSSSGQVSGWAGLDGVGPISGGESCFETSLAQAQAARNALTSKILAVILWCAAPANQATGRCNAMQCNACRERAAGDVNIRVRTAVILDGGGWCLADHCDRVVCRAASVRLQ